jgi:dienelactone hydrolase
MGIPPGSPSEEAITSDFVAFYDDLIQRPEIDPARIVFHGRSLGGGVVCSLARQRPCAAMILESTFTSVRDMARKYLVPGFFVLDPFDKPRGRADVQGATPHPHGRQDPLIPFKHAERLLEAAGSRAKLIAYDAGHNDFPPNPTVISARSKASCANITSWTDARGLSAAAARDLFDQADVFGRQVELVALQVFVHVPRVGRARQGLHSDLERKPEHNLCGSLAYPLQQALERTAADFPDVGCQQREP